MNISMTRSTLTTQPRFGARKSGGANKAGGNTPPGKPWGHVNMEVKPDVAKELLTYLNSQSQVDYLKNLLKNLGQKAKITPLFPPNLSPQTKAIIDAIKKQGMDLQPTFPGTDPDRNPELAKFFIVSGKTKAAAEKLINNLLKSSVVTAAYVMPPAEPPGI